MNASPSSSPPSEISPTAGLFPLAASAPQVPTAAASAAGGARKLSHWEDMEEVWFPEETDFSHCGINE